jgi:hypothetical protein
MMAASIKHGMLRAGGWGNERKEVGHLVYVAPNEGGAGPQSLARSISRNMKFRQGVTHD